MGLSFFLIFHSFPFSIVAVHSLRSLVRELRMLSFFLLP